ncbi:MAG: sensor histidine kinase, partial [Chitinophagales bacterium]
MDIYKRKSRIKIVLIIAAIVVAVGSLLYTNHLASKIAHEEKQKVKLWADALEKRANLVKITSELFQKISEDQRKDIENWAEATKLIIKTEDIESITFLSKILTSNNNIPVILTNEEKEIIDNRNIDLPENIDKTVFLDSLLQGKFQENPPIEITYPEGKSYIYYSDSRIFSELKNTLHDLTETFIADIVVNSASLPVILVDDSSHVIAHGNIDSTEIDSMHLSSTLQKMQDANTPIEIDLGDGGKRTVYYQNSFLLKQLKAFPYIQFFFFGLLMLMAYLGFSSSRRAEQNRVWVGMAKETAHQLGTPISSLSAWLDYMKEIPAEDRNDEQFIAEVEKDVDRLALIAERFSKIGSTPDLKRLNVNDTLQKAINYVKRIASDKVKFEIALEEPNIHFAVNEALFNWVIENLIKNALDAMDGLGDIKIRAFESSKNVII